MTNVVEILQNLIRCPSVTPVDAGAQVYLSNYLKPLGFDCKDLPFGEVPNLFARLGTSGPHLCFAGHTDVVPTGPEEKWTHPPFAAVIANGRIYGRGASDMKGAVAAFAAAVALYLKEHGAPKGSISLLITGDEEGPAEDGTVKVLQWMKQNNQIPDVAIVGEPTNPETLGQEIKVGRRGSFLAELNVSGKQGHVAYPQLADNPLPRLIKLLDKLSTYEFDKGTEFFQPTNLQVTSIDVGNKAGNVIPAAGRAMIAVRYNDLWTGKTLAQKIHEVIGTNEAYELKIISDETESFLTKPGRWADLVSQAVQDVTGKTPAHTTNGGTSDARFIHQYCEVIEVGAVNETNHQIDENAKIEDLEGLTLIYKRILELYFG